VPPKALVLDIETDGDPWSGRLLCVGWKYGAEPVRVDAACDSAILELLADPATPKVTHTKYDARWLRLHLPDRTISGPWYDTQVMAYRLNENTPLTLEYCVKRWLHKTMDKRIRQHAGEPWFRCDDGKEVRLAQAPLEQVMAYNARDVEATAELFQVLWGKLEESMWLEHFLEEDVPFTEVLLDMECRGLPVDLGASEELRGQLEVEAARLATQLYSEAGLPRCFNLNSGPQLSAYLFSKVFELADALKLGTYNGLPKDEKVLRAQADAPAGFTVGTVGRNYVHGVWTLKGRGLPPGVSVPSGNRPSTSSPALLTNLRAAQDPWVQEFLRYRRAMKVLTTYLRRFPELARNGRLYGRFNQTGTVTGRLSSSEPNLQNLPAHGELGPRVRDLFRGKLVVGDYGQLEPRLMAHFSQDPVLLDTFRTGKDVYLVTARGVFGREVAKDEPERQVAKTLVLALGYGAGPTKLAQILTINGHPTDEATARGYLRELQRLYRVFFEWREAVIASAKRKGYISTIGGAHRRLSAQFRQTTWKARGYGERQAVNAIIQGSAGDVVRRVMVRGNWLPEQALLAQVHDELVWEWHGQPPDARQLEYIQQVGETAHGFDLSVPLLFEPHYGGSWYEGKEGSPLLLPEDFTGEFEDVDAEPEEAVC
jgi:DNA polymerase-1